MTDNNSIAIASTMNNIISTIHVNLLAAAFNWFNLVSRLWMTCFVHGTSTIFSSVCKQWGGGQTLIILHTFCGPGVLVLVSVGQHCPS